ncbi:MAG: hypothetical protein ACR2JY_02670 [Chloroflexota bacterium]
MTLLANSRVGAVGGITPAMNGRAKFTNQPVRFPEPVLDNLFYRLDKVYARTGTFAELQARLVQHRGVRYLAVDYLSPAAREKAEYCDLLRDRNRVAALMRALHFKHGERPTAYAVGTDLAPRAISLGQLLGAMECPPETTAAPLPADTNGRVMAAYEAMREDTVSRLGRSRRSGGDTRLRRYLSRELRALRTLERNEDELRRISILQQAFLDYLPSYVVADLDDVRRLDLRGDALMRRLEAMRERHRLQPPADSSDDTPSPPAEIIRIVCSDGLAGSD